MKETTACEPTRLDPADTAAIEAAMVVLREAVELCDRHDMRSPELAAALDALVALNAIGRGHA